MNIENMITDVIATFISQKRAFTAYEVYLEIKKLGCTEPYFLVKNLIHNSDKLLAETTVDYSYKKKLISISKNEKAFLYYHFEYDITQYSPLPSMATGAVVPYTQTTTSVPVHHTTTTTTTTTNPPLGYSLNFRNQLFVYTKFLRMIGLKPQDNAVIIHDPSENQLLISNSGNGILQKVERNGDIRISYTNLVKAGLSKNHRFQIENIDGNTIKIYNIESDGSKL